MGVDAKDDDAWPADASAAYEKIRPLGRGAFGTVWMAKALRPAAAADASEEEAKERAVESSTEEKNAYVAIKRIHTSNDSERAYAVREVDILSELDHPNILKLIQMFSSSDDSLTLCVLSLALGPNVARILKTGGALGLPLARLVGRHLVAAVGYLHSRGVVHRDIKPDNCVLVQAQSSPEKVTIQDILDDDVIWSDGPDGEEAVASGRYNVVLVDFGFARALRPKDVEEQGDEGGKTDATGGTNTQKEGAEGGFERRGSRRSMARALKSSRGSVARIPVRAMSALGTRAFAAPEVKGGARDKSKSQKNFALTEVVSDYGMVSDSFSVGATLKEVLTGVPADVTDIASYISSHNSANALSSLFSCGKKKKSTKDKQQPRKKKYRQVSQVPRNAADLVRDLTRPKGEDRLTVREAQDHPWIAGDVKGGEERYDIPKGDVPSKHGNPIVFLKCVGGTGVLSEVEEE